MVYRKKIVLLSLATTIVAIYVLLRWTSSFKYASFDPLGPVRSVEVPQPHRKDTPSFSTTKDPTISVYAANEGTSENLNQDGDDTYVEQHTSTQEHVRSTESTSTSEHLSPDQTIGSVRTRSSECDEPSRDTDIDELLSRYRRCMGRLVTSQSLQGKMSSEVKPTPEEFGMLNNGRWQEMAGRLATVKKGCDVPAVKLTPAPLLTEIIFDRTHHLAYSRHGKAASTSLLSFFLLLNHVDVPFRSAKEMHLSIYKYFPRPTKERPEDILKRSFFFTAVRHPFRRLVSAYCNLVVESNYKIILSQKNRRMSSEEREEKLLKYKYKGKLGTREPPLITGPWIRRAIPDRPLPEGLKESGSLLAHYLIAPDFNSTRKENLVKLTTNFHLQGVHSEEDQIMSKLSPAQPFRDFVHGVALELLNCGSDPSCFKRINSHIKPQVIRWNPCVLNFDMVMKVETLDQDIELMKELLGLSDPNVEGEEDQTGKIEKTAEERTEENLSQGGNQMNLRRIRAVFRSDDAISEKRAWEDAQVGKTIFTRNRNIARNSDKKATTAASDKASEFNSDTGFFRENTSGKLCATYEEYMKQLSQRDIDLIYTSYNLDFKLFGYEPFD